MPRYAITIRNLNQHSIAGNIDVFGNTEETAYLPGHIPIPSMTKQSWKMFARWLSELDTENILTISQLINLYEQTNPPIDWG